MRIPGFKDEAMRTMRSILIAMMGLAALASGCAQPPKYGVEQILRMPAAPAQVWAVAPAINLSGQREVDPLLQSDVLFAKLQEIRGLTVIPVNRVAEVYASLKIEKVQSKEQAVLVCDLLGCDALIVPTVTAYDAYDPPKFGGALQMFRKPRAFARSASVDPRDLARAAAPTENQSLPTEAGFVQAVGMFDAANGSIREAVWGYAQGRHDPLGPMGRREYLLSMDRYLGFAYHTLVEDLLRTVERESRRT
jgi:hypothetical protein